MPKKKASSPRKRSTKAATQTRSTTSSTTAKTTKKKAVRKKKTTNKQTPATEKTENHSNSSAIATATFLKNTETPQLLSEEIQYAYMTLLSRGASPAAACTQIGILLTEVIWTMEQAPEFASMIERVQELLSQNVAAALYRSAMEGSVSAQQNYLKAYPPPNTRATASDSMNDPELDLTEEELIEYLKAEATAFLAEFNQKGPPETGSQATEQGFCYLHFGGAAYCWLSLWRL